MTIRKTRTRMTRTRKTRTRTTRKRMVRSVLGEQSSIEVPGCTCSPCKMPLPPPPKKKKKS